MGEKQNIAKSIIFVLIAIGLIPAISILLQFLGYGTSGLQEKYKEVLHHYNSPVVFGLLFVFGSTLCIYIASKKLLWGLTPILLISIYPLINSPEKTNVEIKIEDLGDRLTSLENKQISNERQMGIISNPGFEVLKKPTDWINQKRHESLGIKANEGFCFLTGVKGHFAGGGEYIYLYIKDDGNWWIRIGSQQKSVGAQIYCVKYPLGR